MSDHKRAATQYAFFIPEGAGYLFVRSLKAGTQGTTALVLSCADHQLYVRKRGIVEEEKVTGFAGNWGCEEVYLYRSHPLVPPLIDWTVYHPFKRTDPGYSRYTSTSTIWKLCSGGDLGGLIKQYRDLNASHADYIRKMFPYPICIPEAFVWKAFGQLIQAVNFLHHARPLVTHQDIFPGNIFLQRDPGTVLFDCYLGDFGKAAAYPPISGYRRTKHVSVRETRRVLERLMSDYTDVVDVIKQLMTLEENAWITDSHGEASSEPLRAMFNELELENTGSVGSSYDVETFRQSPEYPNRDYMAARQDRGVYQKRGRASGKRYSPLLFDTIRQFEKRIQYARGEASDPNFFPNVEGRPNENAVNRDWSYLGKAMEERVGQRMGQPDSVLYPAVDQVWLGAGLSITTDLDGDVLRRAILYNKADITDPDGYHVPTGPFRIARVDSESLRVLSISRETYHTFDSLNEDRTNNPRLEYRIKPDSDHSVASDPLQMDGIPITRQLNRGVLGR